MVKMKVDIAPFTVPNFVGTIRPARPRQEGFFTVPDGHKMRLSDLDEETLDELCQEFRANVFRKAGKEDPKAQ